MTPFILGTRGSRLALRQTELVAARLGEGCPDLAVRIETIRTTGDRHPEIVIGELPGVGFFVKELELALLDGTIDAAVHSMKDLPSEQTPRLVIAAIPERDDPRDALVARNGMILQDLPSGARVGTSSPRRTACLRTLRPDLTIVPMRGNVDTRVRRVDAGDVEAVCLAAAGLKRAGLAGRITQWFSVHEMIPAPGQGALGVQMREQDERAQPVAAALDHAPTRSAVMAERIVLRRLEAGCRLPLGAYAAVEGERLILRAVIISPDGRHRVDVREEAALDEWRAASDRAAEELLTRGADLLASAGERR